MMKFISLEDLISRLESSLVEMNTKCSEKLQNCMIEALTKEKAMPLVKCFRDIGKLRDCSRRVPPSLPGYRHGYGRSFNGY